MDAVKEAESPRSFTRRRPQATSMWVSAQTKVVTRRLQVFMSWSQASAGLARTFGSRLQGSPVDGFDIPEELLELPSLDDILSVNAWENCLTGPEREQLTMYLPEGVDRDSTVEALLSGEDFHFKNPLQTWGRSVFAGEMHPDAILSRDLELEHEWNAYSKRLRSYHSNMIQKLQYMKEIWDKCTNPEDFLPLVKRFGMSGQKRDGSHLISELRPSTKTVENADLRKRHSGDVEAVDHSQGTSTRPKVKKQKVNEPCQERSKRLKIKPLEIEVEKLKKIPSEGPQGLETKLARDMNSFSVSQLRPKGRNYPHSTGGTEALKIKLSEHGTKKKSQEGPKRLETKPSEEDGKNAHLMLPLEATKGLNMKPAEGEIVKQLLVNTSNGAAKRQEMKSSEEGPRVRSSEPVKKSLVLKPKKPGVKAAKKGPRAQHIRPLNEKRGTFSRPIAKRLKVKPPEKAGGRLENEQCEEGIFLPQIRLSQIVTERLHNKPPEDRISLWTREAEVKPMEEIGGPEIELSVDEYKSLKRKHSHDQAKILKMESSEEGQRTLMNSAPRGRKGLNLKPLEDGLPRQKINFPGGKVLLPRPKEKRSNVQPTEQGTKKCEINHAKKRQEEHDIANSDVLGQWFKKYVQVTVGPVSGHRFSSAIESVNVTPRMFKDIKRRTEAGEEVHLDTLVPREVRFTNKTATCRRVNEEEKIASFWQSMLINDLSAVHACFVQRKEQMQKLAMSLASSCKSLWEIEVSTDDVAHGDASQSAGYTSPSADYASPSPGLVLLGGEYSGEPSPSGSEPSPSGSESPTGNVGSSSGSEPSPSGSEMPIGNVASLSGDEALQIRDGVWPSDNEALPSGREPSASGNEAVPCGDDSLESGDVAAPSKTLDFYCNDDKVVVLEQQVDANVGLIVQFGCL